MNIAEARAYNDGIDFYIKDKNITISARRNQNGEIVITKNNTLTPIKKMKKNPLLILAISLMFTFIIKYCNDLKTEILVLLAFVWSVILLYYFLYSRNSTNINSFKYHAAEHKVLNYWDKYGKLPLDCDEVIKMPSTSIRCGSTLIAVILVLITLSIFGIMFIPWLILKILWCAISIFITLYLWANGKCDFLQKLVLKTPERTQIEVAVLGLYEFINM